MHATISTRLAILTFTLLAIGCANVGAPTYNTEVILKQAEGKQTALWVYPKQLTMDSLPPSAGLNGTTKPTPLPRFLPHVEPPFVAHMEILSDGSLIGISPVEYAYESKRYTIAKYHREVVKRVKVIRFDHRTGEKIWSQNISAEGVYDIAEIKSVILFSSNQYDKDGKFAASRLVALNRQNGAVLWQRHIRSPFRYFTINAKLDAVVFSITSQGQKNTKNIVEVLNVSTGKTRWSVSTDASGHQENANNSWPIIVADKIILFENGVSMRKLNSGGIVWRRNDLVPKGLAQPKTMSGTIWLQSDQGLTALAMSSGKTRWVSAGIESDIVKMFFTGQHLYVVEAEPPYLSKPHTLSRIDPRSGKIRWRQATDAVIGNIVEKAKGVYFSTATHLVAKDVISGNTRFNVELPWEDVYSNHVISINGNSIIVKNEWNAALWRLKDGSRVYHHPFQPLCPIITTKERMKELKAMGAQVTALTAGAVSYTSYIDTAKFTSQFNQAMSNYRSTGNTVYLSEAQANYGMARSSIAQQRALSSMQFAIAMSMASYQIGTKVIKKKIQTTHSMVYPQIDAAIKKIRSFDNGEYVVRLVGVQIENQRFAAVEVLHEATGKTRRYLLSPYQMPQNLITVGSEPMYAHELNGYLPASIYLGHGFSTVVDMKRKSIYHYGPGLRADQYVYFGGTGFARGKLWKFAMDDAASDADR